MNAGIFIAGVFVTLIVAGAMGLLIWGLRMEARRNAQRSSPGGEPARSTAPAERAPARSEN